jgi:2,5-furandicarboxylate decarboxylase 1
MGKRSTVTALPAVRAAEADVDRFRLRRFVDELATAGELETHEQSVDLADVAAHLDENPRAVYFRSVGPEGAELVGNVAGSRARLACAFDTTPEGLLAEVLRRLKTAPRFVELDRAAAPVQQVVLEGAAADLTALPVHLQHGLDGAPYISSAVDIVHDAATGLTNVGMRRMMLRGPHEAGIDLLSPSDLKAIYEASVKRGETLPIAFVVGSHPVDHIAATMRIPVDEVGLIGSLRNAPLPLVKCVTNDLRVPADAEFVLEGYLDARGHVESEGPYGEFLGYYGAVKRNPVFHLTAITRRRDALFQTSTIAGRMMSMTDSAQLVALRTEVTVWRALETAVRETVGVHVTTANGGMFNVRVALRQRVPGEARNAIAATFGCLANIKHVFVVDPDIDIFSHEQMDWALATRFQADRDLVVEGGFRALPLDPSLDGRRIGSKAGFDLTLPFGRSDSIEAQIPKPPRYEGRRFASVEAALADGPKTFEALMAATGSRDGREIVRLLDALRRAGRLGREEDGRWRMEKA